MRADRLLSILLLLQARGQMTGRELAERLEVAERTVHRDMEALSAAGVPVFAMRGSRGGWQLDENWRTQVPGLDEGELRALLMAQPRMIGDSWLAASAERALDKLMAALPFSLREQAASMRQRLYVDATGWHGTNEDMSMLPIVQNAVSRDRKLKIRYRKMEIKSGEASRSERIVDPLGLVAKGNVWYLVAQTTAGLRTFRVSRIEEATLLDKPCERPANFDLPAYWKSSTERFKEQRPRYYVTLRLEPSAAKRINMWRITSPLETQPPDPEGWTTLRVQFDHEIEARFVILGFGPQVEVIEPTSLRERIAADITKSVERQGIFKK
jgi:predicted DNA-binding transcriptional regulator YafY